uniref:Uncharacterized protein n=1 Tax=viral metagenome TaxID=1070528 RepID=A0A6C0JXA2_9ZZZZ
MHITTYIGIVHLGGIILENLYGFIFPPFIFLDNIYAITFISIPFSWILCKDECIISYIVKKWNDPTYIMGTNPADASDIPVIFTNAIISYWTFHINTFVRIWSIYIVNTRTCHIPNYVFGPSILLYLVYVNDIQHEWNYRKRAYPLFQLTAFIYFGWFLCIIIGFI